MLIFRPFENPYTCTLFTLCNKLTFSLAVKNSQLLGKNPKNHLWKSAKDVDPCRWIFPFGEEGRAVIKYVWLRFQEIPTQIHAYTHSYLISYFLSPLPLSGTHYLSFLLIVLGLFLFFAIIIFCLQAFRILVFIFIPISDSANFWFCLSICLILCLFVSLPLCLYGFFRLFLCLFLIFIPKCFFRLFLIFCPKCFFFLCSYILSYFFNAFNSFLFYKHI